MANNKVWILIHHENVETPYFEITNGPISLCIDEEDIPFEETKLCKDWCEIIAKSLSLPHNVRSENKLELDQHITVCTLQDENKQLKELLQDFLSRHETGLLPDRFIYEKSHNFLFPDTKNKTV